mmetsp:Transcript_20789/g.45072  ORF Transcript_20789/g.45072 Transcript_20789/m.45072 type:complete len:93 (-) Transcript_20789:65-343(-)
MAWVRLVTLFQHSASLLVHTWTCNLRPCRWMLLLQQQKAERSACTSDDDDDDDDDDSSRPLGLMTDGWTECTPRHVQLQGIPQQKSLDGEDR